MKAMRNVVASLLALVVFTGCTSLRGPSAAEQIMLSLGALQTAEEAEDVAGMLAIFSDDFSNADGATKQAITQMFEGLVAQGVFEAISFDTSKAQVTVDGDSATATPVSVVTPQGVQSFTYHLKKESDGVWRIVDSVQR